MCRIYDGCTVRKLHVQMNLTIYPQRCSLQLRCIKFSIIGLSGEPLLGINGNDKKDRDAQNAFDRANKIMQRARAWIRAQRRKMFG